MPLRGGVEQQVISMAMDAERAQVGGIPPQRAGQIVKKSTCRSDTAWEFRHTEAVEGMNLEMGKQQLCRGQRIEKIRLNLLGEGHPKGKIAKADTPTISTTLRHKNLGGCHPDHLIEQCLSRGQFRDTELAGAQVGAGQTESPSRLLRGEDGGCEVVALLLESRVHEGSGTNDPGDLAADELSRLDLTHLLAQRDAAPGG